jgi:hypothetical protein
MDIWKNFNIAGSRLPLDKQERKVQFETVFGSFPPKSCIKPDTLFIPAAHSPRNYWFFTLPCARTLRDWNKAVMNELDPNDARTILDNDNFDAYDTCLYWITLFLLLTFNSFNMKKFINYFMCYTHTHTQDSH